MTFWQNSQVSNFMTIFLRFSSCCMYTDSDIADTNDLNRPVAGILKWKRNAYKRIINAFL